ncbi:putative 2OG-Fe(II) oxygenase [Eilatimonas milleporae]|uniref:putative 2OG-Fe(II) oxygenase n=1 Tax=Eilatimonas milleporae TaxID=911205 RepID=UPI0014750F0A|nr:putative 2OG-Fe(II) oxygenase [Eilatimonas milleporae]
MRQAAILLRQQSYVDARRILMRLLYAAPDEMNACHLMALVLKGEGETEGALDYFRRAEQASLTGRQPSIRAEILNNKGNMLKNAGRLEEALECYRLALTIVPDFSEALFNQALLQQQMNNHRSALELLDKLISISSDEARFWTARALSRKAMGDVDDARNALEQALRISPGYTNALHMLAVLKRDQGLLDEAEALLEKKLSTDPHAHESRYILASIHHARGDFGQADIEYRRVLSGDPLSLDTHKALNQLYWQTGDVDKVGRSFRWALKQAPERSDLWFAYLGDLARMGDTEKGLSETAKARDSLGETPDVLYFQARFLSLAEDMPRAMPIIQKGLSEKDDHPGLNHMQARLNLAEGRFHEADMALERWRGVEPFNQEMWALQGISWDLAGDRRSQWLNNYDLFVHVADISPPSGFADTADYLSALSEMLENEHQSRREPFDQTLRNGTQTLGRLFNNPHPLIGALKDQVNSIVDAYLATLPGDKAHPYLSRNTGRFRYSHSWSVRLKNSGHHVNHVHPMGWISSAFYIHVPDSISDTGQSHDGWLKFGENDLSGYGKAQGCALHIAPKAGRLVLFPSYFWHGTYPFFDQDRRLSVAFDILPD